MDNLKDFIRQVMKDTGRGVKGYLKSQLILMVIALTILIIGLNIMDVPKAILISIAIALIDVLPILGSGLILVPWSIISFILGNNYLGIGLGIIYIFLIISRQVLEPMIMGKAIGVRPLYTFLSTIIGSIILGPVGLILGPLLVVIINSIIKTKKIMDEKK